MDGDILMCLYMNVANPAEAVKNQCFNTLGHYVKNNLNLAESLLGGRYLAHVLSQITLQ